MTKIFLVGCSKVTVVESLVVSGMPTTWTEVALVEKDSGSWRTSSNFDGMNGRKKQPGGTRKTDKCK